MPENARLPLWMQVFCAPGIPAQTLITKGRKKIKGSENRGGVPLLSASSNGFIFFVMWSYFYFCFATPVQYIELSGFLWKKYRFLAVIHILFLWLEATCFIQWNVAIIAVHNYHRKLCFISLFLEKRSAYLLSYLWHLSQVLTEAVAVLLSGHPVNDWC